MMTGYWRGMWIFYYLVLWCDAFKWEVIPISKPPVRSLIDINQTISQISGCQPGWVWSNKYNKCIALCLSGCENGVCEKPNKCSCKGPLILKRGNACVKRPLNAKCGNTLESCQCDKGYTMKNDICAPMCSSECINGYCESPKKCSCNDGYVRNVTNPNICYEPPMKNFDHLKCTVGGECFCYCTINGETHGLVKVSKPKDLNLMHPCSRDMTCKPKCTHECVNGTCVGLDVCECAPPLQLKDKYTCIEPGVTHKVNDIWWLVCSVSALIITTISFFCCMSRRKKYVK